jgi:hypothetical protein
MLIVKVVGECVEFGDASTKQNRSDVVERFRIVIKVNGEYKRGRVELQV